MNNRQKLSVIAVFAIPFLGLLLNFIKWGSGCLHALDFGIYQQAILDLAFTSSWNPVNTVRGISIFADHFDPILLFAAGIQKWVGPIPWFPLVIEFGFYYAGGIAVFLLSKPKPIGLRLTLTALWFFCSGMTVAFRFPIHPTTWSALPLLMLAYALKLNRFRWVLIWLNVLCFFKEYYPICFVAYGAYLLTRLQIKKALVVLLNGALWIWATFSLRARLLPDFYGHGNGLLTELLANPGLKLLSAFQTFGWGDSVVALLPFLFGMVGVWRFEKNKNWWWSLAAFMVPIFGIQFLFGNIGFQYGAPIAAFFLSVLILSDWGAFGSFDRLQLWLRRGLVLMVILLAVDYLNCVAVAFVPRENRCRFNLSKWREFERMATLIRAEPAQLRILASGGLVPLLVKPDRKIYQYGVWSKVQDEYELIAIGRNDASYLYPFGVDVYEKVISACRPFAKEVLLESENVFVARGKFTEDCLHQRHSF